MSEIKGGGPAFPSLETFAKFDEDKGRYVDFIEPSGGMTLRDYFAAQALPSALAEFYTAGEAFSDFDDMAQHIYGMADAMIRAREAK